MDFTEAFKTILTLSFMGSILALIIMLTKKLFKGKLNVNWHYYIWFLLVIRLIVPYAPESPFSVFNLLNPAHSVDSEKIPFISQRMDMSISSTNEMNLIGKSIAADNNIKSDSISNEITNIQKRNGFTLNYSFLGMIWVSGAALMLLYMLIANRIFMKKINRQPQRKDEDIIKELEECRFAMNIGGSITLIYTESVTTPSLCGLVKPKLLMPYKMLSKLSEAEKKYVYMHELAHLKRKDILVNWVIMLIQILHWFNPVIWYAFYKMREDCEVACDAYVLSRLKPLEYKDYGETILNLMSTISRSQWRPAAASMVNNKSSIKKRIKMVAMYGKRSWKWSAAAGVLLLGIILIGMTNGLSSSVHSDVLRTDNTPKIKIAAEIRNLTQEEYSEVGTKGLDNPSIDDFRKFILNVEITDAKNVASKQFSVPDLNVLQAAIKKTGDRFWFAGGSDQNNKSEDFSRADRSIVIYYRGLKENELREVLKPLKIQVGWAAKDGNSAQKECSVGEILIFEN